VASVFSPIFLARATTELAAGNYHKTAVNASVFCALVFGSKLLKEMQNLVYLEVKRVAYAEVREICMHAVGERGAMRACRKQGPIWRGLRELLPPNRAMSSPTAYCVNPHHPHTQICNSTFEHLLDLSLHWHLKKKLGQVIRSMDR
jgi:sulfatase maturation enzyme AslB (radical SAM superfamily)